MRMEIVDSQVVKPDAASGWPEEMDEFTRDKISVDLALAQMDAAGVDAGVISAHEPVRPKGDTTIPPGFAELAFSRYPKRFAAIMSVQPETPDVVDVVSSIRSRWTGSKDRFMTGWLGIRVVISWPPDNIDKLHAGAYEPIFSAAERHQIPTCIFLSGDLQHAAPIAEAHPDLIMIIDHFGLKAPPIMRYDNPPFRQLELLLQLAKYPNVSVKFSGAAALSREVYPFTDIWPSLHKVVEAFGPERLMWGADYTRTAGLHTYAEAVNYLQYSTELSEHEKELIFGVTLRRVMRWPRR